MIWLALLPLHATLHRVQDVPASFDCSMRQAAYAYGQHLLPRLGAFPELYWALGLNSPSCHTPMPPPAPPPKVPPPHYSRQLHILDNSIFVAPPEPEVASTAGDGSKLAPFRSIQRAADAAALKGIRSVVLRGGTYHLYQPIQLSANHSGIHFMAHPDERPVVSGGKQLTNLVWKPHNTSSSSNIWVADLEDRVSDVPGLQIDGVRATRARYPNLPGGIEVSPGYGSMIPGHAAHWTRPDFTRFGNVTFFTDVNESHTRPNAGWFEQYMIGTHGLCSVYDPPVSYWCSQHPSGGGAFAFRTPSGIAPKPGVLKNAPYQDASDAIFFVWRPARWANWMFEVQAYNPKTNNFTFGKGGNQGARGADEGGDYFVENVMEELDSPGEFFFDRKAGKLYLFYNGTGAPPQNAKVVVPQLRTLVNITGTQWRPVRDVQTSGVTFAASRYTYMDKHGVPSAGDWALDRVAAVFMQGTERVHFDNCTFERLDGNGVMVSGYNRNVTISNSDFAFLGGNAIAAWGYTNETDTDPGRPGIHLTNAPAAGVDGTDGEHPRYTSVINCSAREVGLYEKQSSFYVQAKTAESRVTGNVFFNGPRAGINANDGFGGGDEIAHNLVFSTCRESGDHGPFNSWDRQPFLTTVRDGKPSMQMAWREIHHNFFIDNYSPQEGVDNDDGSAYYKTHDNFLVYGNRGMKNDFGGHDNHHYRNLYAYVGQGLGVCEQTPGHEDYFYDNKVILTGNDVGGFACDGKAKTIVHGNDYFTKTGNVTECKMSLDAWQAKGNDNGSSVAMWPKDEVILGWARQMLSF